MAKKAIITEGTLVRNLKLSERTIEVVAAQHENTMFCGLRQEWFSGEHELKGGGRISFEMLCGAGYGSPYAIVNVKGVEFEVTEVIDMSNVFRNWLDSVLAERGEQPR